jgi:hypothetical protein
MGRIKPRVAARQAVAAQLRSHGRRERRRTILIFGIGIAVIGGLIASTGVVLVQTQAHNSAIQEAAKRPIAGVRTFKNLTRNHVAKPGPYAPDPPVGGDHDATYLTFATYRLPVSEGRAVHSLEHGAVWITYAGNLPPAQVTQLTEQARHQKSEILSPRNNLPSPIVASAWGVQLRISDPSDTRLASFLTKYQQGRQTPEAGAACSGGSVQ